MNYYGSTSGNRSGDAFAEASRLMNSGGSFDATRFGSGSNGANRLEALQKAQQWTNMGIDAVGGTGDFMSQMAGQTATAGLDLATKNAIHRSNMAAARAEQRASRTSSWLGLGAQAIGTALMFCERRLKGDIQPMDPVAAWKAVRDVPFYTFRYKSNPGPVAYGPMADEVELVDDTLVRPSMLPDDAEGPIRGFDIMRFQAYESVALQAALNRIEDLEARLEKLTDAITRLQLGAILDAA